jgi:hypothetical protein
LRAPFFLLIILSQGHPDQFNSVVPFDFGEGTVDVIGWAQKFADAGCFEDSPSPLRSSR